MEVVVLMRITVRRRSGLRNERILTLIALKWKGKVIQLRMVDEAIPMLLIMSGQAVGQTGRWLIGLGLAKILYFIAVENKTKS